MNKTTNTRTKIDCPVCGQSVTITKRGVISNHGYRGNVRMKDLTSEPCEGGSRFAPGYGFGITPAFEAK